MKAMIDAALVQTEPVKRQCGLTKQWDSVLLSLIQFDLFNERVVLKVECKMAEVISAYIEDLLLAGQCWIKF